MILMLNDVRRHCCGVEWTYSELLTNHPLFQPDMICRKLRKNIRNSVRASLAICNLTAEFAADIHLQAHALPSASVSSQTYANADT